MLIWTPAAVGALTSYQRSGAYIVRVLEPIYL